MATNPLTGGFEAVVQIKVRQVDALLATFHQEGSSENPLKLPHSVRLSLDNRRRFPDLDDFADWTLGFQQARSRPGPDVRGGLMSAAPAGAAARMQDTFKAFDDSLVIADPPGVIRGRTDVQLSTVTLTVPEGSTSEVTTHTHIRAQYKPAPGTTDLPAPIHGEVEATFDIRNVASGDGRRLEITPSANDAKILFHPEPGTVDAAGAGTISTHIRRALRDKFTMPPVDLPEDFPFTAFKGVGTGGNAAIALGLQLSGKPAPIAGLQEVRQARVGPAAFALAVSKDFVTALFQPAVDALLSGQQNVRIDSFELRFDNGSIDLRIDATATDTVLGAVEVSIRQRVTLVVTFDTLFIAAPDDALRVSVSKVGVPLPSGDVRSRIISARNQALPSIQAALNRQLNEAKKLLNSALRKFHDSASLALRPGHSEEANAEAFGGIAITPDGLFVRGDLRLVDRLAPVVDVRETADETAFTAFDSFVPAGRLEEFIWSWVEFNGPSIWSAELKVQPPDKHRFTLPRPPGITDRSQLCLLVKGTQILPNGTRISVEGGTTCRLPGLEPIMNVPSWWEPVMVPLWRPDIADDAALRDAIVAHVTVQADTAPRTAQTHNSLIFFADWQSDAPFAPLYAALERSRRSVSLVVFVVLPCGAFDARRRELEARLAAIGLQTSAHLHVTEDDEGGWSRTFAPSTRPAAFLINARRQVAWKCDGYFDAEALGAAIDRRLDVAPPPRAVPMRLNVSVGDRLLDAAFRDDSGQAASLHRLQGQRALLHFFLSWSAPCRSELRRLQKVWTGTAGRPSIVAFHGGPSSYLSALRKELGLTFPIVQDVEQEVARTYGVRCWPTTVHIDPSGRIEHVQFGMSDERYADAIE